MKVANKSPKSGTKLHQKSTTMKSNKSGEKTPNLPNTTLDGLSEESQNNNATISQIPPVVGSTKSLIDSIKMIRAKTKPSGDLNSPPRTKRAKIAEPAPQTPKRLTKQTQKIHNFDAAPQAEEAQLGCSRGQSDQPMNAQMALDMQVTVNSSDDEYVEETESSSSSGSTDSDRESLLPSHSESDGESGGYETSDTFKSTQILPPEQCENATDEFSELRDNPKFHQLVMDVLKKGGTSDVREKISAKRRKHIRKGKPLNTSNKVQDKIKSPSDTTIYAPALAMRNVNNIGNTPIIGNPILHSNVSPDYASQIAERE